MAAKTTKTAKVAAAPKTPAPSKNVGGPTSGVMAPGAVGRAAREAAQGAAPGGFTGWRDPNATYADNDQSIDARMWRLSNGRPKA